ncbi:MAG: signal peptide peptidase SppA [Candidatus Synoicihabitans palmerolidicus]|nr:signal peptide peptidase SppA [Candidatus Synoicihabitans palmerolidicus]
MKTFLASLLGTLAGFLLFIVGGGLLTFLFFVGLAALGNKDQVVITPGSYLVFDLATNIMDAPAQFDDSALVAAFLGQDIPAQQQTRLVTRALYEAASDDRIKGVLLTGSFAPAGYGTSFATLQEVRRALLAIKTAGKPIHAYLQYPDTRDFYIATVADDLALDPNGALLMPGLASQPTFLAGTFEKFGIGVQVARAGKYKSAIETYTRRDFSPENREQLESLLGELWQELRDTVAESRNLEPAKLQALMDSGDSYLADDVLATGLVDRLIYVDEILDELKAETGGSGTELAFKQVNLAAYISQLGKGSANEQENPQESGSVKGQVAVIYTEGNIVNGEGGPDNVGGARYAREIRRLRQDPDIKAIVLRVNSPGGSATASEHIQREIRLALKTMPVVVSMGGYAASGGYWISAYSNRIFAEETTITGSIGVWGVLFNMEKLGGDLGLSWDTVKTGKFADAVSASRAKTPEEMALFQRSTDEVYKDFMGKVSEGRSLEIDTVRDIAQGRVWTGAQALEIGLVDEIGGLSDAIAYAAAQADLQSGFRVREFPRKKEFAEVITEALNKFGAASAHTGLVGEITERLNASLEQLGQFNDPQGIYARMPVELIVQ